jgi:hypothetical protein
MPPIPSLPTWRDNMAALFGRELFVDMPGIGRGGGEDDLVIFRLPHCGRGWRSRYGKLRS